MITFAPMYAPRLYRLALGLWIGVLLVDPLFALAAPPDRDFLVMAVGVIALTLAWSCFIAAALLGRRGRATATWRAAAPFAVLALPGGLVLLWHFTLGFAVALAVAVDAVARRLFPSNPADASLAQQPRDYSTWHALGMAYTYVFNALLFATRNALRLTDARSPREFAWVVVATLPQVLLFAAPYLVPPRKPAKRLDLNACLAYLYASNAWTIIFLPLVFHLSR
jgi:hypothetical protein